MAGPKGVRGGASRDGSFVGFTLWAARPAKTRLPWEKETYRKG